MDDQIVGRNPVLEALRSGRSIVKLLLAQGATEGSIRQIRALARERGIPMQEVGRARLDTISPHHQGVVAVVAARSYADLDDILARVREGGRDPLLLVLDGVQDPQNLGALVRIADAAGVQGVIIPERRATGLTATVAKVSAGAIEYVPVARVTNLVRTLQTLKEEGFWICGADVGADQAYHQAALTGPLAVVIGGEGRGLGRLVGEHCDFRVRIPMHGRVNSLNAAMAGAVLLFEVQRQRQMAHGSASAVVQSPE